VSISAAGGEIHLCTTKSHPRREKQDSEVCSTCREIIVGTASPCGGGSSDRRARKCVSCPMSGAAKSRSASFLNSSTFWACVEIFSITSSCAARSAMQTKVETTATVSGASTAAWPCAHPNCQLRQHPLVRAHFSRSVLRTFWA